MIDNRLDAVAAGAHNALMRFILAALTALALTIGCASTPTADAPAPDPTTTTTAPAATPGHPNSPCEEDEDRFDAPGGIICRHFEGDGERFIPTA